VDPAYVYRIHVFRSTKSTTNLTLPNKKLISDYKDSECKPVGCCKHRYIGKILIQGKVKDVENCTEEFIPEQAVRRSLRKSRV